jgi:glutathione S-transferase
MKIDFNGSLLYITARSPFARRVRLAFLENGVKFEEKTLDLVKNPHPEFFAVNPLKRVPAVQLAGGEVIVDSNQILNAFYAAHPESPLLARSAADRITAYHWSGISTGLCEKLVEYFFEMQREESARDSELLEEIRQCIDHVTPVLAAQVKGRQWIASSLSQADLDAGSMLDYLSLRYSSDWVKKYPDLARYHEGLRARLSFRATVPPPPA